MITIHMTTHRRLGSGLLQQAVESVLLQDFTDFEFIVCDDASVDGTAAYLDRVAAADRRVRVFHNPSNVNSVAISLGRCLQQSSPTRSWVSWMFDDCILLPGALSHLVAALKAHPNADMLYGVTEVIQKDGSILRVGGATEDEVWAGIADSSVLVPNGGILVHRNVFTRHGWYDASVVLRRSCDWDLFRRIILGGVEFVVLPHVVMREFGELQPDALRNAFATTFDLMARFAGARDASGVRLDLANALIRPMDWIPPAAWSTEELDQMRYMFSEYFLSVGDISRAFRWARLLAERLDSRELLMRDNLLRHASASEAADKRAMAVGAFTGIVLGGFREQRAKA